MLEYGSFAYSLYQEVIKEQIVLSDNGVSMEYTDTIDSQSRKDLLQFMAEWREEHPLNNFRL